MPTASTTGEGKAVRTRTPKLRTRPKADGVQVLGPLSTVGTRSARDVTVRRLQSEAKPVKKQDPAQKQGPAKKQGHAKEVAAKEIAAKGVPAKRAFAQLPVVEPPEEQPALTTRERASRETRYRPTEPSRPVTPPSAVSGISCEEDFSEPSRVLVFDEAKEEPWAAALAEMVASNMQPCSSPTSETTPCLDTIWERTHESASASDYVHRQTSSGVSGTGPEPSAQEPQPSTSSGAWCWSSERPQDVQGNVRCCITDPESFGQAVYDPANYGPERSHPQYDWRQYAVKPTSATTRCYEPDQYEEQPDDEADLQEPQQSSSESSLLHLKSLVRTVNIAEMKKTNISEPGLTGDSKPITIEELQTEQKEHGDDAWPPASQR